MTSDLWYVGKVLANEPKREDGGVGQKRVERKGHLCMELVRRLFIFLLFIVVCLWHGHWSLAISYRGLLSVVLRIFVFCIKYCILWDEVGLHRVQCVSIHLSGLIFAVQQSTPAAFVLCFRYGPGLRISCCYNYVCTDFVYHGGFSERNVAINDGPVYYRKSV